MWNTIAPRIACATILLLCAGCDDGGPRSVATSLDLPAEPDPPGEFPAFPFIDHVDQARITEKEIQFEELFILGDELFETKFNSLDGAGIGELPDGTPLPGRFSRVPPGGGRITGPNGQGCDDCHNTPFGTSAGTAASNVLQDPSGMGQPPFNVRNTPSLFGTGMIQRLAEELTEDLLSIRDQAADAATPGGPTVTRALVAQGISFGSIRASRDAGGRVTFDTSQVEGISPDLVIRPFGWKGDVATIRDFGRGAAFAEMGMLPDELAVRDPQNRADPDGDGVVDELSVGDITSIIIYIAAQEEPTTIDRMVAEGRMNPPSQEFFAAARLGRDLFDSIACTTCHVPRLLLEDPIFEEPTLRGGGNYFDALIDAADTSFDPVRPFRFHLSREGDVPRPIPDQAGRLPLEIFGDFKRHRMGIHLADAQPTAVKNADGQLLEFGNATVFVDEASFLTPELWGVGNTGPWLHDGRAGSLEDAILLHGVDAPPLEGDQDRSEAQESRDAFVALSAREREGIVTFLRSLIHFDLLAEE